MTLAVAAAREGDIAAILAMVSTLSAHEGMPEPEVTAETLREVMFGPAAMVWGAIARKADEVVGYALWNQGFDTQSGSRTLHIIDLYVAAPHRRAGVARALVRHLAGQARDGSIGLMTVQALASNAEANGFYRAVGATPDPCHSYYFTRRRIDELSA